MAIHVLPGSASLKADAHPSVNVPFIGTNSMNFTCKGIHFQGSCKLAGDPADSPAGWTLGLIQVKWIDTDWAFYRGQADSDGSLFLQAARKPALSSHACRDTITPGAFLIDNNTGIDRTIADAGATLPLPMNAAFGDAPARHWPLTRVNTKTGKINFLRESQTEIHFCTILTLVSPAPAVFHHLKCIYWNVHWQGRYLPTNFANAAAPWKIERTGAALGNMAHVSHATDGAPTDHRFAAMVTLPSAPTCNSIMRKAFASPNVRESHTWHNFVVTQ